MELSELIEKIHENAVNKHFWDCPLCGNKFGDDHKNKCVIPEKLQAAFFNMIVIKQLALINSEVSEIIEADRSGKFANIEVFEFLVGMKNDEYGDIETLYQSYIKGTFEEEIADTIIRILDLCGGLGIDIEKFIKIKMEYNKTRPALHGKKY